MLFDKHCVSSNPHEGNSHEGNPHQGVTGATRGVRTFVLTFVMALIAAFIMTSAPPVSAVSGPVDTSQSEPVLQARSGSSTAGVDWRRETPASLNSFSGRGIAYGNGYFVAVTSETRVPSSKVARSTDGRNWEVGPDAYSYTSTASWSGIAFGGGVFVAVASDGGIMTSTNGLTWTARLNAPNGEAWSDIAYGNGTFVAIAPGGWARYSADGGATWTRSSLQNSGNTISALAFGNGIFVAVGTTKSFTSIDGITWANSDSIASQTGGWNYGGLAYGNDKWIALPSDNGLSSSVQGSLYSTDGLTWTAVNPLSNVPGKCFNAVTYGAGLFVAFSCNRVTPAAIISPDGIAWTSVLTLYPGTPPESPLPAVAYGDGMFVSTASVAVFTSQPSPAITGISPSNGPTPGGRTVTISGTALQNTTAVTFNGAAATSFANVSSTQITAVVPAGTAGSATVGVTTWGGSTTSTAFTYVTPPVITSLTPTSAPTTGGRTIIVTGTDLGNTTSVTVGGVAATGIVNTSGTEISFVSPAGSAGSKSVVLTTEGGGSVTLADGITNVVPPVIASLSPALGLDSGGTSVTVTGTNLANTISVTVGGAAATSVTNVSDTEMTFTTPSGTIGTSDVVVTTSGGGPTTSSGGYRYIGQPTITSISPAGGPTTGSTSVVITGTNLTNTTSVTIGGSAATVTANTDTAVTVSAPALSEGVKSVVLQTWSGVASVTSSNAYTYATPPIITSFTPTVSLAAGGGTVTLTGVNLLSTTGVTVGGAAATDVAVVNSTQVTFTIPAGTAGLSSVALTTTFGGTATVSGTFRYIEAPTISTVTPNVGPVAGGTRVTVSGTNLENTTSVTVGGVAATAITNTSSTSISFTTAVSGVAGLRDVVVNTYSGVGSVTSAGAFRYVAVPTITSVTPTGGPVAGGTTVTIKGTNLTNTTSVTFGSTPATSISNVSPTQITAVAPAHASTSTAISIETYDGIGTATLSSAYSFVSLPVITSLSTSTGLTAGGTVVTVTGANLANTSSVTVGGTAATNIVNVSGPSVRFTTPSGVSGQRDVVLTTTYGGSTTSTNAFRYIEAPTISTVSPSAGPTAGGSSIVISGTHLNSTTSVTIGGVAASITGNTGTSVIVTTPVSSAGEKSIVLQTYDGVGSVTSTNAFTYVSAPTITSLSRSVATVAGGQIVVVTGTNLSDTSSVTLGSTSVASLVNDSATSVQFVVPIGTVGLKDLRLTTTYGGSVTSDEAFRYIESPTVTSITPDIGPTAGGTSVTIIGANLSNVTQVNIGGFIGAVTANTSTSLTFTTGVATSPGLKSVTIQTYSGAGTVIVSDGFTYVTPPTITSVTPALGLASGGTSVSINGSNLLNAGSVTFGGVAGTVTANTGTAITVTTPAATPGVQNVVVTTLGGGSVTSAGAFTFVGQPAISDISPDAGPTTGGLAINIAGTNLGNATTVTFGGNPGSITSSTATAITVIPPASAFGRVDVIVETHGGIGTVTASSAYTYVTPPMLTSISPTSGVAGTPITLIGTSLNPTSAVTVGSQSATFTVVSDTEVQVIAPSSLTGTRVITLTTPGGSVIASQLFTFPDPPAPDSGGATSESVTSPTVTTVLQGDLGPEPPASPLQPGQEIVMVGGQRIPVSSSANRANNGLSLLGDGWGLVLETLSPSGKPTALGANGALVLTAGGSLPIGGSGYAPGTDATVYLMSTPQLLGVLSVNAQGELLGTLVLPAGVSPGNHTLQVNGLSTDGLVRSISLGVTAKEPSKQVQRVGTRVLFDSGRSELSGRARQSLKALAAQVTDKKKAVTIISAGLRSSGATASDRKLARQRADNVGSFLRDLGLRGSISMMTRKIAVSQRHQDREVFVSVSWKAAE